MAIVNAKEITPHAELDPLERELCDDLVLNRRPDALQRVIEHWDAKSPTAAPKPRGAADDDAGAPVEMRIHNAILRRRKDGIEAKIDEALRERDAVDVLNNVLLPAMKEVGDKFGAGELILPFVLQSAEVMKKAVAHLEQFLEKREGVTQGQGRARDGFRRRARHRQEPRQYDLDEQRLHRLRSRQASSDARDPREGRRSASRRDRPVGAARFDLEADAGLRRRTGRARSRLSVLVGGAAINRDFGRRIAFVGGRGRALFRSGRVLREGCVRRPRDHGRADGDPARRDSVRDQKARRSRSEPERARANAAPPLPRTAAPRATALETRRTFRAAPFFGSRLDRRDRPAALWKHFDLKSLYRLSWGGANVKGEAWETLVRDEFEPRLARYQRAGRTRRADRAACRLRILSGGGLRRRRHRLRSRRTAAARSLAFRSRAKSVANIFRWRTTCASREAERATSSRCKS